MTVQSGDAFSDLLGPKCPSLAASNEFQFVSNPVPGQLTALKRLKVGKTLLIPFKMDRVFDGTVAPGIKTVLALRLRLKATRVR